MIEYSTAVRPTSQAQYFLNGHFILKQLTECIQKIKCPELVIAYEPVWSIGTGIIPKVKDIIEVSELIFSSLHDY